MDVVLKSDISHFELQKVIIPTFFVLLYLFCPNHSVAATGRDGSANISIQIYMLWGVILAGSILIFFLLRRYLNHKKSGKNRPIDVAGDTTSGQIIDDFIQSQAWKMGVLSEIIRLIANNKEARLNPKIMTEEIVRRLDVDAATILLLKPADNTLEYAAGYGFHTDQMRKSSVKVGEGLAGRAALEQQVVYVQDLTETGESFSRSHLLKDEGFISYAGLPLIAKGQIKGVLEVFFRRSFNPDNKWFSFFETLAGYASIASDNALLSEESKRFKIKLEEAYDATIEGWLRAMELSGKETKSHIENVVEMTVQLARTMGMSGDEIVHIRRGAVLHDIGMLGVPNHILLKPGRLTETEWEIMRKHPQFAFDALSVIDYLCPALDIPYCHHEKWDGTGYPRGLKGTQISIAARIFSVVDVWDALRSERPYRSSWPDEMVWEHIRSQSGEAFDPKVVDAFLRLVRAKEQYRPEPSRTPQPAGD